MNKYTSDLNLLIAFKREQLKQRIEYVCEWIDRTHNADRYQLFQSDGYKVLAYRATKALNSQLKKMLRRIPNLKIVCPYDIAKVVLSGMEEVRDKHNECGADGSEVRWVIEDAVHKALEEQD